MSRTINKLDQNDSHKRATIANVQASTPYTKHPIIQHSISLSRIDTASSSSGGRKNLQLQMQDLAEKHKRLTKKRKTEDTKIKDSDSECEAKQERLIDESLNKKRKRKKNIEKKIVRGRQILKDTDSECEAKQKQLIDESLNKKRKRKKNIEKKIVRGRQILKDTDSECEAKQKQLIDESLHKKRKRKKNTEKKTVRGSQILKDTDSEWETESERSINKLSTDLQVSILDDDKFIKLFEDPCNTPEKTRDIPSAYEETLHTHGSPIIGAFTKSHLISKKNDIILPDTLLPVNLQLTEERNLEESDENETTFHCESNATTRVSEESPKGKPENFMFLKRYFPTTTDSLHRNQFVKTYSRKISRHSSSSSSSTSIKLMDLMRKLPNVFRKRESSPISPGMVCEIGSLRNLGRSSRNLQWIIHRKSSSQNKRGNDKKREGKINTLKNIERKTKTMKRNMKKFIRKQKYDAHDLIDKIDNEFETGGQDGKRISFRDFCLRQKKNKDMNILED